MLIQPSTDNNKINIIIKPSTNNYSPLKIKYFIYRGINKADYFTNNVLNQPDVNKPITVTKLWTTLLALNGLTSPSGNIFPLDYVYDFAASGTKLIDDAFQKSLVSCIEGDYIGNFNNEVGLDIVLDHGDYTLENQEILFNFNLDFARAQEFIFDTDTLLDNVKKKRYRENIHQFLDAAAFWGSHINCGTIKLKNNVTTINSVTDVSEILKKYQTGNKLYIYLQENNRSFNYYDSTRKIFGFTTTGENNETDGWPILIKEANSNKNLLIEYKLDVGIPEDLRRVSLEIISGKQSIILKRSTIKHTLVLSKNRFMEYDLKIDDPTFTIIIDNGQTLPQGTQLITSGINFGKINGTPSKTEVKELDFLIKNSAGSLIRVERLKFYVNALDYDLKLNINVSGNACADMIFINCDMLRKSPPQPYFNNLWIANVRSSIDFGTVDVMSWATYDKNRNLDLEDVIGESAILQNKVFFDQGKKTGATVPLKDRRLFAAVVKNNSSLDKEYHELNIDKITSGSTKSPATDDEYFMTLFNDPNFKIYKGTFMDGARTLSSLSILNNDNLLKRYSYLFLGLTENDYSKLIFPSDSDNVFFNLKEVTSFSTDNVRKFNVGLCYENVSGTIITIYPPSTSEVSVYSLDGLFFFSEDYSEYQHFFYTYPKAKGEFRIKAPYSGEFGFDWMRVGDTGGQGDVSYKDIMGKLYEDAAFTTVVTDINEDVGFFKKDLKIFQRLEKEYLMYTSQLDNNIVSRYYLSTLNIYPPYVPLTSGIDLDRQSIFSSPYDDQVNRTATINLHINIKQRPSKIFLKYDSTSLDISPITIIPTTVGIHTLTLTIKTHGQLNINQYVKVIAVYDGKDKLIGVLKVAKNAKINRKSKNVVIVTVRTNVNGDATPSANDKARFLKKYLRQIFITPIFDSIKIDLYADSVFNTNYIYTKPSGQKVLLSQDYLRPNLQIIDQYIVNQNIPGSSISIKDQYPNSYIIVFFEEEGGQLVAPPPAAPNNYKGLNGYSNGRYIVVFASAENETPTHEFLHSADIPHSFTAYEADKFAKFTYKPRITNNILDYSHKAGITRSSLWEWQGKIARNNSKNEP